jgi:hypothetical protein
MMFGTESGDENMQIAATVPKTLPCASESQLKSPYRGPQKKKKKKKKKKDAAPATMRITHHRPLQRDELMHGEVRPD